MTYSVVSYLPISFSKRYAGGYICVSYPIAVASHPVSLKVVLPGIPGTTTNARVQSRVGCSTVYRTMIIESLGSLGVPLGSLGDTLASTGLRLLTTPLPSNDHYRT